MERTVAVGIVLRELRGKRTQEQVAYDLGITKSAWAMYERGLRTPRDETKLRIAEYFGRTVQEIFFRHGEHYKCLNVAQATDRNVLTPTQTEQDSA